MEAGRIGGVWGYKFGEGKKKRKRGRAPCFG